MLETAGLDSTILDAGIAAQQLQLVNAIVDEDRQYATRLTITRTDNENASESVISTVISWLMKKKVLSKEHCDSFREGTYSTPDGWNGTTELEQGNTALASKRNSGVPGCVVWAMELDEQDHRLIYGRWHTRIGIIGNAMTKAGAMDVLENSSQSETLIVRTAVLLSNHGFLAVLMAGLILAGILASTMSTSDSQLLAASSSISENL